MWKVPPDAARRARDQYLQVHASRSPGEEAAETLLQELRRIYKIVRWDRSMFEKAVVEGALRASRPHPTVEPASDRLQLTTKGCPLEHSRGLCGRCMTLQKNLLKKALGDRVVSMRFHRTTQHADDECVFEATLVPGA